MIRASFEHVDLFCCCFSQKVSSVIVRVLQATLGPSRLSRQDWTLQNVSTSSCLRAYNMPSLDRSRFLLLRFRPLSRLLSPNMYVDDIAAATATGFSSHI